MLVVITNRNIIVNESNCLEIMDSSDRLVEWNIVRHYHLIFTPSRSSKASLNTLLACNDSHRSYTTTRKFFVVPPLTRIILILSIYNGITTTLADSKMPKRMRSLMRSAVFESEDEDVDGFDDIE
jgi:hypothetical protein